MTGYVQAFGLCVSCRTPFAFNPHKVPSLRVNSKGEPDVNGEREPVCASCMDRANKRRITNGEPPHPIEPDAYEAIPEHEL